MNSTDKAWMAFAKAEGIVEDVPSKDVSLEGKLDVLSAQMNQISVDTQRVADVVPELLGDEGVEEALKQEEDAVPNPPEGEEEVEKEDDAEGAGEEIALSEGGEDAEEETVGDDEDPEGIFTDGDEVPAEDGEEVEETEPIAEGEPAEVEAEPDAEGDEQEDDAQDITEEEGSEKVVEETVDEEPAEEKEVVVEKEPVEEPKKKVVLTKSAFGQMYRKGAYKMKKSAFVAMRKGEEPPIKEETVPQDIENSADANVEDSDEIKCAEGAATAGSAGMSSAVYGEKPVEEFTATCKSMFVAKYGTPHHTGDQQGTGASGNGSKNKYRGKTHPAHPKGGKDENAKRYDIGYSAREEENKAKRQMREDNYPNYDKRLDGSRGSAKEQHARAKANKKKKSKKSFLEAYQSNGVRKADDFSNIPTKHVANMMEIRTHQRPVAKATANGDIVRPTLETAPVKKNIPMGYGVSPADATAGDWADYNAYKARMGLR